MSEFVSTATFRDGDGKLVFTGNRREASDTDTQARKSASRYWSGFAEKRGWELAVVYCVRRSACGFVVSERQMDRRGWGHYLAPEKPSPQVEACIKELGGKPLETTVPPEIMTINGWTYHRGDYAGEI